MPETIIFKPINKINNVYTGSHLNPDKLVNISKIICKDNLRLNDIYYLKGEYQESEERENINEFLVEENYEYKILIGELFDIKPEKTKLRNIAKIKTREGKIYKCNISFEDLELNKDHILKGYFDKKNIFQSILTKPLITLKLKISSEINTLKSIIKTNKLLQQTKAEIIDGDKKIITGTNKKIYIKGTNLLSLYKDDEINAYGYYIKDEQFFNIINYEKTEQNSKKLIETYIKNIIPVSILKNAQRDTLLNTYDTKIINILEDKNNLKNINDDCKKNNKKFKMISDENLGKINECILTSLHIQDFFFFCDKLNISNKMAISIFNEYRELSKKELQKNPYKILEINNDIETFKTADIISKNFSIDVLDYNRIKAGIFLFLSEDSKRGNVYTIKDDLLNNLDILLNKSEIFEPIYIGKTIIEENLKDLEKNNLIKIIDNEKIYLKYNYFYEKESAKFILNLINDFKIPFCKKDDITTAISFFEKKYKLADKQKDAIYNSLLNNISILTGGPGTGKTLTVSAIINTIIDINPYVNIKLCAPTGRAAKRMTEVSGSKASTIHKLLNIGIYENSDDDEKSEELEDVDFLIIDEFSMVDIKLFYEILKNLDDKTRVIIVGDYHQLPSVEPGQVMKDLILSNKIPTIELVEIFRQKGNSDIIKLAHNIITKKAIDLTSNFINNNIEDILDDSKSLFFMNIINEKDITTGLYQIIDTLIEKKYKIDDFQILNSTNVFSIGSNVINKKFQKIYNEQINEDDIYYFDNRFKNNHLNIKDRVIQTENNYDLKVMNGSIGYIKEFKNLVEIEFPDDGQTVFYKYEDLTQLKLAYSISIHKSQGSEYPIVILPFSYCQKYMLNMNLLYTGITRAKGKLILVGDYQLFLDSLKIEDNNRNSNLLNLLL